MPENGVRRDKSIGIFIGSDTFIWFLVVDSSVKNGRNGSIFSIACFRKLI